MEHHRNGSASIMENGPRQSLSWQNAGRARIAAQDPRARDPDSDSAFAMCWPDNCREMPDNPAAGEPSGPSAKVHTARIVPIRFPPARWPASRISGPVVDGVRPIVPSLFRFVHLRQPRANPAVTTQVVLIGVALPQSTVFPKMSNLKMPPRVPAPSESFRTFAGADVRRLPRVWQPWEPG